MKASGLVCRVAVVFLVAALLGLPGGGMCADDEGQNFQVSPPPIAYPYFVEGRQDTKLTLTFFQMSFQDISISGGGFDVVYREAIDKTFAWDIEGALMLMTSKDLPVPPVIDTYVNGDMVIVQGLGDPLTTFFSIPMSMNLEIQAVHEPEFSMIVFAGPNLSFLFGSISPPRYQATIWDMNFDGKYTSLTATHDFGTTVTSMLGGLQFGTQFGIPAGDWNFAPFFMLRATGGTMSMTQKSGYREVDGEFLTFDIPMSTATSIGTDIIYEPWGLSIGALLQQISANKKENEQSSLMLQASYHFRTTREKPGAQKSGAMKKTLAAEAPSSELSSIAVLSLKPEGISENDVAWATDYLRTEIAKTGAFETAGKKQTAAVAGGAAPCTGTKCAVEAGKALGVEKVVVGEAGETTDEYFLRIRVVDVKTGKVVHADEIRSESKNGVKNGMRGMAEKIAGMAESK